MQKQKITLSQWAKQNDVGYRTAWNKYKAGYFQDVEISEKGSIFIWQEIIIPRVSLKDILSDFNKAIENYISNK